MNITMKILRFLRTEVFMAIEYLNGLLTMINMPIILGS